MLGRLLRAAGAGTALTALLAGLPAILIAAAGWPLPSTVPTWHQATDLLTGPALPDEILIDTLACVGWICWALLTLSALLEIVATARHVPTPRLPGLQPAQAVIGALVAALALTPLLPRPSDALAAARPAVTHIASQPAATGTVDLTGTLTLLVGDTNYTCTVRPGDTLWDLADTWLGDPHRWPEIYHLNTGHHFPDTGGTLTNPNLIYPGWHLTLPDDARPPSHRNPAPRHTTATPPSTRDAAPAPAPAPSKPTQPATSSTGGSEPTPIATTPGVSAGSATAAAEPTGSTIATRPTGAGHQPGDDDGVTLPGGWISFPFAAALIAATTLAWRRRRRHHPAHTDSRPPDTHPSQNPTTSAPSRGDDAEDALPLPASVIAARRQVRRLAPDLLQPAPPDLTVRQAAQARREGRPVPPPPPPGPDGRALVGLPTPTPPGGLALTGPGADDAARALLVATLTAGGPDDGDAQGHVVIPRPTWQHLFAPTDEATTPQLDADRLPRLTLTDDLDQALTHIEAHLITRRRLLLDADTPDITTYRTDPDHEPIPLTLLITTPPAPEHADRLNAAATLGAALNVTVLILGPQPGTSTLALNADGHTDPPTPDTGSTRLAVLSVNAARDLLTALADPAPAAPTQRPPAPAPEPSTNAGASNTPESEERPDTLAEQPTRPDDASDPTSTTPSANGTTRAAPASATRPRATAHVLGTPSITGPDGTPVDSVREAALELLTYLAVHRDGATLDDIKEALYGDATRTRATQRLATDVANLRNRIRHAANASKDDGDSVINTGGRYHLNPEFLDVDWWHVQDAVTRAKAATTPDDRRTALQTALAAYHGPLADDCDYDWATHPREHTRRTGNWIHAHLARLLIDTDPATAATLLETACNQDPYDEDLARLALQAHARTGNTQAIKTRMNRLRTALDELDDTPDNQTEQLARTLLARSTTNAGRPATTERPRRPIPPSRESPRPR